MIKSQQVLINFLNEFKNFQTTYKPTPFSVKQISFGNLNNEELAQLYVDIAFLNSSIKFLSDEIWLQEKSKLEEITLTDFLDKIFIYELSPILFLQPILEKFNLPLIKLLADPLVKLENDIIVFLNNSAISTRKEFLATALDLMTQLFDFENKLQAEKNSLGLHLGLTLYRSFDSLDKVLNLNYQAEVGMATDSKGSERLYEGSGQGVQSGYSTVLLALEHLKPKSGSRFIDLGSGYGRVGMIVGLIRPDIKFDGYEYVEHRVASSRASAENLDIQQHVQFYTQDLSLKEFKIPSADIYYLYDPFCEETYAHVLDQLVELSRVQPISIVTKGNAKAWLLKRAASEGWSSPVEFDNGNLCVFQTEK